MVNNRVRLNSYDLEHNGILSFKFKEKQKKNVIKRSEQIFKSSHKESKFYNVENFLKYYQQYNELSKKDSNEITKNIFIKNINFQEDFLWYVL
jgi:hypothetical protein